MTVAVSGRRLLASRRPELSRLITCVIDNELLGLAEGISGRLIPCQRSAPAIVVALDPCGRLAVFDLEPELFSQLPRPGAAGINPWEPGHGHPAGSVPGVCRDGTSPGHPCRKALSPGSCSHRVQLAGAGGSSLFPERDVRVAEGMPPVGREWSRPPARGRWLWLCQGFFWRNRTPTTALVEMERATKSWISWDPASPESSSCSQDEELCLAPFS